MKSGRPAAGPALEELLVLGLGRLADPLGRVAAHDDPAAPPLRLGRAGAGSAGALAVVGLGVGLVVPRLGATRAAALGRRLGRPWLGANRRGSFGRSSGLGFTRQETR